MDFSELTDAQLRETLKEHGMNVGPIVASTRRVYEKKLLKMINGEGQDVSVLSELNGSQLSSNGNGADARRNASPVYDNGSPTPVFEDALAEELHEASDSDDCEESMRFLTEEEMAADRAAARQSSQKRKGGIFGSALTFAVLFVTIAVFAYFLLENVEKLKLIPEPKSDDVI